MKRITTLILAAVFALGGAIAGHAESNVDIKVKGQWDFVFGWAENTDFQKKRNRANREDDNFIAAQRIRTQINFIMSENLQGVLQFEIGDVHWGNGSSSGRGAGGKLGTDGVNVETKHAYLDWMVPGTALHIRMGLQGLALPMGTGLGNPVFDDDVAAITASYQFDDTFGVTAFWARPYNRNTNDSDGGFSNRSIDDELDMFGVILPVTLDGFNITPWGVLASVGSGSGIYEDLLGMDDEGDVRIGSGESAFAWWAGLAFSADLYDPLTFGVDVMYGSLNNNELVFEDKTAGTVASLSQYKTRGWFIAANLDYKLDWATPGIFGWWSTGDDKSDVKDGTYGRMPTLPTSSGFAPTTFGFDGGWGISDCDVISTKGIGTWGIGLQIADMSFIEDLQHTIRVAYYRGTNDHEVIRDGNALPLAGIENIYLTDKDSAIEVNFDHTYQIYENLTAVLELGWINLDLDKNTWNGNRNGGHKTDDAWKAQLSFQYKF